MNNIKQKSQELVVLKVSGKDARRYLNSRFSNNIKSLTIEAPKNKCGAAALTAQGQTECFAFIQCTAAEEFLIFTSKASEEDSNVIIKIIEKFKVADRFDTENTTGNYNNYLSTEELIYLGLFSKISELNDLEILNYKFNNSIPSYGIDFFNGEIFSESNLWNFISNTKGCYVGQEVIERANAIGKLPYKIAKFEADISNNTNTCNFSNASNFNINTNGKTIGKIRSFLLEENLIKGFVRISNKYENSLTDCILWEANETLTLTNFKLI